jgi:Mg2+ and Co2+ transporter CorA
VHNEYEAKLQEVTAKTAEKNEFFLNLIQQMQQRHYEEINYYRGLVDGFEEEKKQMGSIETKMNQIGAGIEDILRESSELSRTNEELERKLLEKDKIIEGLRK